MKKYYAAQRRGWKSQLGGPKQQDTDSGKPGARRPSNAEQLLDSAQREVLQDLALEKDLLNRQLNSDKDDLSAHHLDAIEREKILAAMTSRSRRSSAQTSPDVSPPAAMSPTPALPAYVPFAADEVDSEPTDIEVQSDDDDDDDDGDHDLASTSQSASASNVVSSKGFDDSDDDDETSMSSGSDSSAKRAARRRPQKPTRTDKISWTTVSKRQKGRIIRNRRKQEKEAKKAGRKGKKGKPKKGTLRSKSRTGSKASRKARRIQKKIAQST